MDEFLAAGGRAYQIAVHVLGSSEGAEDVVQQAYVNAVSGAPRDLPPEEAQAWFLKVTANAAKMHLRGEVRRRKREVAVLKKPVEAPAANADGAELVEKVRSCLAALDEKYRLPVALCCEQGLSHRTAAEILEVPASTVSLRVSEGLQRLRAALARAGFMTAPAAVLGELAHTAPPVPAGLVARMEKLVTGHAMVEGTGAAAVSVAAKGGMAMKAIVAVVLAGTVAAGAAGLLAFGTAGDGRRSGSGGSGGWHQPGHRPAGARGGFRVCREAQGDEAGR
jgi:RNA polymerase sigma-70 factor (ECF subfamily)